MRIISYTKRYNDSVPVADFYLNFEGNSIHMDNNLPLFEKLKHLAIPYSHKN